MIAYWYLTIPVWPYCEQAVSGDLNLGRGLQSERTVKGRVWRQSKAHPRFTNAHQYNVLRYLLPLRCNSNIKFCITPHMWDDVRWILAIENDKNRNLVFTFLLNVYTHYISILHHLVTICKALNTLIDHKLRSYRKGRTGNSTNT